MVSQVVVGKNFHAGQDILPKAFLESMLRRDRHEDGVDLSQGCVLPFFRSRTPLLRKLSTRCRVSSSIGFFSLSSAWQRRSEVPLRAGGHSQSGWQPQTTRPRRGRCRTGSSLVPRQAIERTAPQKAYDLLDTLQRRNGTPIPGYIGGKDFRNRERRLPHGRYREYDVNRKLPGRSRDAERLVIEQHSGKAYYTDDHYRTFIPLN